MDNLSFKKIFECLQAQEINNEIKSRLNCIYKRRRLYLAYGGRMSVPLDRFASNFDWGTRENYGMLDFDILS